jgi:hypothetical protein
MLKKIRGISLLLVMVLCGLVFLGVSGLIRSNKQAMRSLSDEDERIFAHQSANIALLEAKEQAKSSSLTLTGTCSDFKSGGKFYGFYMQGCPSSPSSSCRLSVVV